ncbi:hypothetical protein TruAng_005679 [Truncatella angustata]|nr:hypothetical protein TruAng_005679 [Truncatella angustata]
MHLSTLFFLAAGALAAPQAEPSAGAWSAAPHVLTASAPATTFATSFTGVFAAPSRTWSSRPASSAPPVTFVVARRVFTPDAAKWNSTSAWPSSESGAPHN